jgi:hypothetical protein
MFEMGRRRGPLYWGLLLVDLCEKYDSDLLGIWPTKEPI